MGGTACVLKKKMCNPPALARLAIPEEIIASMGRGELSREILEAAGLEDYLYRRAAIDEYAEAKAKDADDWFYRNVALVESRQGPKPAPWGGYEHRSQSPSQSPSPSPSPADTPDVAQLAELKDGGDLDLDGGDLRLIATRRQHGNGKDQDDAKDQDKDK